MASTTEIELTVAELEAAERRQDKRQELKDEAAELAGDLSGFIGQAWPVVEPHVQYLHNWHIEEICAHLTAITDGEIRRLQIWVPPGSMKSLCVSVFWPAWEWCRAPWQRYLTASYDLELATDFAVNSRKLMLSQWYQARWGDKFSMHADQNLKRSYRNDQGGSRFATSPTGGGTGRHGTRILIDDPLNAKEEVNDTKLNEANRWYDTVVSTRAADPKSHAEVIIMQRLHERDLAQHVLGFEDWEVLCLPEVHESSHPFVSKVDQRSNDGELLWPDRVGPEEHEARARKLGAHKAAGQLQQRPAAREGELLKRAHWRYYDPKLIDLEPHRLPKFSRVVSSWDTAFKDKTSSDFVVGTVWGQRGADRYLLRIIRERMAFGATKRSMKEVDAWIRETWPGVAVNLVIEKAANGVEIIEELKREITGTVAWKATTDKYSRAEAAEPTLESGNCFLPGRQAPEGDDYDPDGTPAAVQSFVEELAGFDKGEYDDQVDSWSQAMNYLNQKGTRQASVHGPPDMPL